MQMLGVGLLLLCFTGLAPKALAVNTDSLYRELKLVSSELRKAQLLLDIGSNLRFNYPDSALRELDRAMVHLRKTRRNIFMRESDTLLLSADILYRRAEIYSVFTGDYRRSLALLNDAEQRYLKAETQGRRSQSLAYAGLGNCLMVKGNISFFTNDYDKAEHYYQQAADFYRKAANDLDYMRAMNNLGNIYRVREEYLKALEHYALAKEYFEESGALFFIAGVNSNMGLIYQVLGDPVMAAGFFEQAMRAYETLNNTRGIATVSLNLGNVFADLNETGKALEYYHKSLQLDEMTENLNGIAIAASNIAYIYFEQGNSDMAMDYHHKAIDLYLELNNMDGYHSTMHAYARHLLKTNQRAEALQILHTVKSHLESQNMRSLVVDVNADIARYYLAGGNSSRAIALMEETLEEALALDLRAAASRLYLVLTDAYEKQGNVARALEMHRKYHELNTELFSLDKQKGVMEIEARFRLEKVSAEVERLRQESLIGQMKLRQQEMLILLGIFVILLLSGLAFAVNIRYRLGNRHNKQLEDLVSQLQEANQIIQERNQVRDKLFSVISHDLRSPFSGLIGLTAIMKDEFASLSREDLADYIQMTHNTAAQAFNLFENLLHWGKLQLEEVKPHPGALNLYSAVSRIEELFANNLKIKKIELENKLPEQLMVWADGNMIEIVIRNLISNAIKFSYSSSQILIEARQEGSVAICTVTNYGVPIPPNKISHLFTVEYNRSTPGTMNEKGTGLGLILCREMIEMNKGRIWIEKSDMHSTSFCFSLPALDLQKQERMLMNQRTNPQA